MNISSAFTHIQTLQYENSRKNSSFTLTVKVCCACRCSVHTFPNTAIEASLPRSPGRSADQLRQLPVPHTRVCSGEVQTGASLYTRAFLENKRYVIGTGDHK